MKIGIERLISDLSDLGFNDVGQISDTNNAEYALVTGFIIPVGSFAGRSIDLAIPAPTNYPQGIGASIHIRSIPPLVEKGAVQGLRNVIDSAIGAEWQYWSYRFNLDPKNPTGELIAQINGIFHNN